MLDPSHPDKTVPDQLIHGLGAVILCGGKSERMGVAKHALGFNGETFLQRVAKLTQQAASPVVCVGPAADAPLAADAKALGMQYVCDDIADQGPLEGLRCGLAALAGQTEFAFVTSCDVPLIRPALIRFLAKLIQTTPANETPWEAVMPVAGQRIYGITAVYRTDLHKRIVLSPDKSGRKVSSLAKIARTLKVSTETLRQADPELDSLMNINTPQQYVNLLARYQLEIPTNFQAWKTQS